ncbi:MAG: site-2 protease family protein [Desulfomonile sp.]|nr:site-2 protease family protein [Desulfomonile sp.]
MFDAPIAETVQRIALVVPGFLLAITVHEFTHGYVALRLGDPTAKAAGRLTFNPLTHLDPIGTVFLVLTQIIGWAKPVPVDPRYFRNPRTDMMWVSLGGPAANMVTAVVVAGVLHAILFVVRGLVLGQTGFFFLWPIVQILQYAVLINVALAIFNLVPIPPLDGSKILAGLLPDEMAYQMDRLEPYGFIILVLLFFTRVIDYVIIPPIRLIAGLLLKGFG